MAFCPDHETDGGENNPFKELLAKIISPVYYRNDTNKRSACFQLQAHRADGTLAKVMGTLMTLNPSQAKQQMKEQRSAKGDINVGVYRVILNFSPYTCIMSSDSEKEINKSWERVLEFEKQLLEALKVEEKDLKRTVRPHDMEVEERERMKEDTSRLMPFAPELRTPFFVEMQKLLTKRVMAEVRARQDVVLMNSELKANDNPKKYSLEALAVQLEELEKCNTVGRIDQMRQAVIDRSEACRSKIKDHLHPEVVLLQYIKNRRQALVQQKGLAFDVMAAQYMENREFILAQLTAQTQRINELLAEVERLKEQTASKSLPAAKPIDMATNPNGNVEREKKYAVEEPKPGAGEPVLFRCSFCKSISKNTSFKCDHCGMLDFCVDPSGEVKNFEPEAPPPPPCDIPTDLPDTPARRLIIVGRGRGGVGRIPTSPLASAKSPAEMLKEAIFAAIKKRREQLGDAGDSSAANRDDDGDHDAYGI